MLNDSIAMISIFLLVPALIAVLAVRGYKQILRQEQQEAEEERALKQRPPKPGKTGG